MFSKSFPKLNNKNWLHNQYIIKELSSISIAKKLGCDDTTVTKYLSFHKILAKEASFYRKYKLDKDYFKAIDSHEKAQIFGFICADGYNSENNGFVKISLHHQDEKYLKFILKSTKSNIPIKTHEPNVKQQRPNVQKSITIACREFSKDLAKLGCIQAKSLVLKFPSEKIISEKFLNSFLLGYFEGDGGFIKDKDSKRCFAMSLCGTFDFCNKFNLIVRKKFKVCGRIYKHGKVNSYGFQLTGARNIQPIFDWLYKNAKFRMARKYIIYKQIKKAAASLNQEELKRKQRNIQILKEFNNGAKTKDLAIKYQLNRRHIQTIICKNQ